MPQSDAPNSNERDRANKQKTKRLQAPDKRDVPLQCIPENEVSHTPSYSPTPEAKPAGEEVSDLTWGELKADYPQEFECWKAMKDRERKGLCTVHPDMRPLQSFFAVMGPMPEANMTVDRIDNNRKEYAPGNVRWASKRTQANNRSNTIILTNGEGTSRPLTEWAKLTGQDQNTLRQRRKRGWSDIEIIEGSRKKGDAIGGGVGKAYWPVPAREQKSWEVAYQRLSKHYHYHPGFSRRVFLCWMAQNRARSYSAQLEKKYPDEWGEESNPEGDLVEVLKNPIFKRWENCRNIFQSLLPKIQNDRQERDMMQMLLRRPNRPFQPWQLE